MIRVWWVCFDTNCWICWSLSLITRVWWMCCDKLFALPPPYIYLGQLHNGAIIYLTNGRCFCPLFNICGMPPRGRLPTPVRAMMRPPSHRRAARKRAAEAKPSAPPIRRRRTVAAAAGRPEDLPAASDGFPEAA